MINCQINSTDCPFKRLVAGLQSTDDRSENSDRLFNDFSVLVTRLPKESQLQLLLDLLELVLTQWQILSKTF